MGVQVVGAGVGVCVQHSHTLYNDLLHPQDQRMEQARPSPAEPPLYCLFYKYHLVPQLHVRVLQALPALLHGSHTGGEPSCPVRMRDNQHVVQGEHAFGRHRSHHWRPPGLQPHLCIQSHGVALHFHPPLRSRNEQPHLPERPHPGAGPLRHRHRHSVRNSRYNGMVAGIRYVMFTAYCFKSKPNSLKRESIALKSGSSLNTPAM